MTPAAPRLRMWRRVSGFRSSRSNSRSRSSLLGVTLGLSFPNDVNVLCGPGESRSVPGGRQPPARLLVRVGHQNGHRGAIAQAHDHLRGRAQVERALDLSLHAVAAVGARAVGRRVQLQLLRADYRVRPLADAGAGAAGGHRPAPGGPPPAPRSPTRAPGRPARTVGPASSFSSTAPVAVETTSPGIRFDTPM